MSNIEKGEDSENKPGEAIKVFRIPEQDGEKPREVRHPIPHGQSRLIILSLALAACLWAGISTNTPSDTRSTFLSIASAIITGLIRPFDR
jgi:hypothetical protein